MNAMSVELEPGVTRYAFDGNRALLETVRGYANRQTPPARIDTAEASMLWSVCSPITQVPAAGGVSPLALENIIQLRLLLHPGARWGWYYPVEKLDSPVLDLLNVRYLLAGGEAAARAAALPKFRHLAGFPGIDLFENLSVMPRFFVVHQVRRVASIDEARTAVGRGDVDLRRCALTEEPMELRPGQGTEDEVRVLSYQSSALELTVRSHGTGLLVLSESDYPGWYAWLDEKPVAIHRVDIAFRGVVVPDGEHRVRMAFQPAILPISLGISLATGLLLVLLAFRKRA